MPAEYKTITVEGSVDDALNAEAADGWRVHTVTGPSVYLLERVTEPAPPPIQRAAPTPPTGPRR